MKAVAERTLLRIGAVSATLGIITFFVAREGFLFTLAQATPWFCADADFCAKPGHSKTAGGLHKNGNDPSRRARRGCQEGDRCRLKRRLATSLEEWEAARDLLGKLLAEQIERAFGHGGQWGQ
jgi:hypothetical protein